MVTRIQECAEAVCSALHELDFEFMGESEGGRVTWFKRGVKPKQIRVSITRGDLGYVTVKPEWYNISLPGRTIHGEERLEIWCETVDKVTEGSYKATVRVLEIFRDVLEGKGVAGPEALAHLKF